MNKGNRLPNYDIRLLKVYLLPFIENFRPETEFFICCVNIDSLENSKKIRQKKKVRLIQKGAYTVKS